MTQDLDPTPRYQREPSLRKTSSWSAFMKRLRRKRASNSDSPIDSCVKRPASDAKNFRPLGYAKPSSHVLNHYVGAAVSLVLLTGNPSAIFLTIVAVIIYSVYLGIAKWPLPHVLKEAFKVSPSRTYRNPAPTVATISDLGGVIASLEHMVPYFVLSRFAKPMRSVPTSDACLGVSAFQVRNKRIGFVPALASAPYVWLIPHIRCLARRPYHSQVAIFYSQFVYHRHTLTSMCLCAIGKTS